MPPRPPMRATSCAPTTSRARPWSCRACSSRSSSSSSSPSWPRRRRCSPMRHGQDLGISLRVTDYTGPAARLFRRQQERRRHARHLVGIDTSQAKGLAAVPGEHGRARLPTRTARSTSTAAAACPDARATDHRFPLALGADHVPALRPAFLYAGCRRALRRSHGSCARTHRLGRRLTSRCSASTPTAPVPRTIATTSAPIPILPTTTTTTPSARPRWCGA